jgi:hypothetical protein
MKWLNEAVILTAGTASAVALDLVNHKSDCSVYCWCIYFFDEG